MIFTTITLAADARCLAIATFWTTFLCQTDFIRSMCANSVVFSTNFFCRQQMLSRQGLLTFYTIGPKPVFVALSNTPAFLLQTNFDPRQIVYLPTEARALLAATNQIHGMIRARNFSAQRLDFEADVDTPTLLVLSQTYYHQWRAYVDYKPAQILRANYAFQAVEVPAGHHAVRLVYQDRLFQVGAVISVATFASCMLSLFVSNHRQSRKLEIT